MCAHAQTAVSFRGGSRTGTSRQPCLRRQWRLRNLKTTPVCEEPRHQGTVCDSTDTECPHETIHKDSEVRLPRVPGTGRPRLTAEECGAPLGAQEKISCDGCQTLWLQRKASELRTVNEETLRQVKRAFTMLAEKHSAWPHQNTEAKNEQDRVKTLSAAKGVRIGATA